VTDREKALEKLRSLQSEVDQEMEHLAADGVLCELLVSLGYADVVEEWEKVGKWYA
jgi:hypothetical protein